MTSHIAAISIISSSPFFLFTLNAVHLRETRSRRFFTTHKSGRDNNPAFALYYTEFRCGYLKILFVEDSCLLFREQWANIAVKPRAT